MHMGFDRILQDTAITAAIQWTKDMYDSCWAQSRLTCWFLLACGASILLRSFEEWLFSDVDIGVSELCAFGALAIKAASCQKEKKRPPDGILNRRNRCKPFANPGDCDTFLPWEDQASTASSFLRRPRRTLTPRTTVGSFIEQQQPGPAGAYGSAASSAQAAATTGAAAAAALASAQVSRENDASLVEGIVAAFREGECELAETRLNELLQSNSTDIAGATSAFAYPFQAKAGCSSGAAHAHTLVEVCLEMGDVRRAVAWLWLLHSGRFRPSPRTLLSVLKALVRRGEAVHAEMLLSQMVAANAHPDVACFQVLFEHCVPSTNKARVEAWLTRLAQRSAQQHVQGYVALLRAQDGNTSQAEYWMMHAVDAGVAQSTHLYNAVIHVCARAGETERAEWWLGQMEEAAKGDAKGLTPDVISYSAIIDACAQRGETERAEAWFAHMTNAGIRPDAVSFNTVIKAHARAGNIAGAEQWLLRARDQGIRLDSFGYNAVIATAARLADAVTAERWLRQMLQDGAKPDVISFNCVINAWAKHSDAMGAERLVELMCENYVEPNVMTLSIAVHACARVGDICRAEAVFQRVVARGKMQPDAISYNALINAAVKAGDTARAEQWLAAMRKDGIAPSVVSYTTVLHAHARAGDVDAAERGLMQMLKDGVEANVVSYSALIHACVKAGDVPRAERWFERMRMNGIQATVVSYSVLLNVCAKAGHYQRAEQWLEAMHADGITPNAVCYNNIIHACSKAGLPGHAEAWLRRLLAEGEAEAAKYENGNEARPDALMPTRQSYTAAAHGYAVHGSWADVERLFAEMEARGIAMDEFTLTVLLSAYSHSRPRQRERAEAAFRQYASRGLQITKAPLRVLKSVVGCTRFNRLLSEERVRIPDEYDNI